MRIFPDLFEQAYSVLRSQGRGPGCAVLILSACDVDSLCALYIITDILETDLVQFRVRPVFGFDDMIDYDEETLRDDEDLRSAILINCVGGESVARILPNIGSDVSIYVLDRRRPMNIENIEDDSRIAVFWSDEDTVSSSDLQDEEEGENEGFGDLSFSTTKRRKITPKAKHKNENENENENEIEGESAALLAFRLASKLGKETPTISWAGIVSVTEQYINRKISFDRYEKLLELFKLSLSDELVRSEKERRFFLQDDFLFTLYRHWNLYESVYHTTLIATHFALWQFSGKDRLNIFFAKLGIPLLEAKQNYVSMTNSIKNSLHEKILAHNKEFSLPRLTLPLFVRVFGCTANAHISAIDAVYSLSAILEQKNSRKDNTDDYLKRIDEQNESIDPKKTKTLKQIKEEEGKQWISNFWEAFDVLKDDKLDGFEYGIQLAIPQQKAIFSIASHAIETREVKMLGHYRIVFLSTVNSVFSVPTFALSVPSVRCKNIQTLRRIGLFIMDALMAMGKAAKPLVVTVQTGTQQRAVLGIARNTAGQSSFYRDFVSSAKQIRASCHRYFDSFVLDIMEWELNLFQDTLLFNLTNREEKSKSIITQNETEASSSEKPEHFHENEKELSEVVNNDFKISVDMLL